MRRTLALVLVMMAPLALSACSGAGSGGGVPASDPDEAKVRQAVTFLSGTEGSPGIFVKGRDIAVNYATRPPAFADSVRKAALDATKAVDGRQVKIYVVDSPAVAAAIPTSGKYYCSVTANDGRLAGNNC